MLVGRTAGSRAFAITNIKVTIPLVSLELDTQADALHLCRNPDAIVVVFANRY
jgi:hypothetical protein